MSSNDITATIPMPIQVVIDDVGWWSGKDGNKQQEPYQDRNATGIINQLIMKQLQHLDALWAYGRRQL